MLKLLNLCNISKNLSTNDLLLEKKMHHSKPNPNSKSIISNKKDLKNLSILPALSSVANSLASITFSFLFLHSRDGITDISTKYDVRTYVHYLFIPKMRSETYKGWSRSAFPSCTLSFYQNASCLGARSAQKWKLKNGCGVDKRTNSYTRNHKLEPTCKGYWLLN